MNTFKSSNETAREESKCIDGAAPNATKGSDVNDADGDVDISVEAFSWHDNRTATSNVDIVAATPIGVSTSISKARSSARMPEVGLISDLRRSPSTRRTYSRSSNVTLTSILDTATWSVSPQGFVEIYSITVSSVERTGVFSTPRRLSLPFNFFLSLSCANDVVQLSNLTAPCETYSRENAWGDMPPTLAASSPAESPDWLPPVTALLPAAARLRRRDRCKDWYRASSARVRASLSPSTTNLKSYNVTRTPSSAVMSGTCFAASSEMSPTMIVAPPPSMKTSLRLLLFVGLSEEAGFFGVIGESRSRLMWRIWYVSLLNLNRSCNPNRRTDPSQRPVVEMVVVRTGTTQSRTTSSVSSTRCRGTTIEACRARAKLLVRIASLSRFPLSANGWSSSRTKHRRRWGSMLTLRESDIRACIEMILLGKSAAHNVSTPRTVIASSLAQRSVVSDVLSSALTREKVIGVDKDIIAQSAATLKSHESKRTSAMSSSMLPSSVNAPNGSLGSPARRLKRYK
eukprot:PhM_4_TR18056/c0_g1_i3/m.41047